MKLTEAFAQFMAQVRHQKAASTAKSYGFAVEAFLGTLPKDATSRELGACHIEEFASQMLPKQYARTTAGIYATAVKQFIAYLLSHRLLSHWTVLDVSQSNELLASLRPQKVKKLPRLPKEAAVAAMRKAAAESPLPAPIRERNLALVEILYSTGCRISEVVGLRVGDIDLETRQAIVKGKGNKERVVFLSPSAVNTCVRYWKACQAYRLDDPAFCRHDDGAGKGRLKGLSTTGARNVINDLAMVAGLPRFTPHSFRHYFATKMLEETGQLDIVQTALGHSSPETTRIYAITNPDTVRRAHREVFGQ